MKKADAAIHADPFYDAFRGYFSNLLKWSDLDAFWETLRGRADAGWYVYAVGEEAPAHTSSAEQVNAFIAEIDVLLRREHDEDYCGIVYVDDRADPRFVKIYDPNNLGVVCGYSDNPPLPGWVMSRIPPKRLDSDAILPANRRRWWRKLWQ